MRLGFLGCGKMASALIGGILDARLATAQEIFASDPAPAALHALEAARGIRTVAGNRELAQAADVLLLCVKPQDALEALASVREVLAGKLVISIVAGLTLARLEEATGGAARVIRVMPNTPALIGEGAAALSRGRAATVEDAEVARQIFSAVGLAVEVKESLLDAVTGLSGSGPAYVYLFIEALADGGVRMGLPRALALELAAQTVAGAARMVRESGEHPAVLRDQVTSPGGTTSAGLEALEAGAVRSDLIRAVRAATERSRELGA